MSCKQKILSILTEAADRGEKCPSNRQIANLCDHADSAYVVKLITKLKNEGEIRVYSVGHHRMVEIVATGARTYATLDFLSEVGCSPMPGNIAWPDLSTRSPVA